MSENNTTPTPARLCVAKTSNGRDAQNPGRLVGEGVSHPKRKQPRNFMVHYCPHCGYWHLFNSRGRCLSCNFRLDEAKEEIHPKVRRCHRKRIINQKELLIAEGDAVSPPLNKGHTKRGKNEY